jgi:Flp pilus assembly pilin Flp
MRIWNLLREFHNEESGQGFVEYLLIVALIGLAVIVGLSTAANYVNNAFTVLGSRLAGYVGT